MQRRADRFEDAARILHHVIVPEAQHAKTSSAKIVIALLVGFAVGMLATIGFDDQRSFETGEIDNIGRDHVLPAELRDGHPPIAQHRPEAAFGERWIDAHQTCSVAEFAGALALIIGRHTPHPSAAARLPPSPSGERG